ncbi:class II aldolase and adducin N-terminal domain-containing protein [Pseudomonas gingeri]|uniref:Class II aldolase/adducin family protein n=2 Tax=Pseudomonas gingeri TaxID=117681 RepID=A0A7Y8CN46_9PSED|nr:class II aldolase and adducin N-terminal domain-containing protein [Pseudomonas gingeri]NWA03600.1 class II aldolase/adducin family protein [Pseudomonas gingeri]NWA14458.1 class II aldolase/adducin family protein [Pseudomonas gingeri]NWA54924.1 class II aldolase/adducin family protein [Pseudomonas gingeri]NWA94648.1 class II aldolase/adducin family protein [Pseudomonas gingeri]NWB01304.1 class II aldolase/adducin family protein [Pseudomonas gingeri]
MPSPLDHPSLRSQLACAFRWAARLGLHESIANHFSVAVSDDGRDFLINPYGRHFSRIRASDLLLVKADEPTTLDRPDAPDITAAALHGALHRNQPQARCILHVHSKYATALACLADSRLPPIEQNSMRFFERVVIDEGFDGMGLGDEAERVGRLLGDKPILLMGNHGLLVAAPSVAQAFDDLYYFERACEVYITALSTGRPLRIASDEVARKTARQWLDYPGFAEKHFAALLGIMQEEEPEFAL